jgi:hypothetical protein
MGDDDKIIVYPTGGGDALQETYKKLAELLAGGKDGVKADTAVTEAELSQKSLFIMGGLTENKLTKMFVGNLSKDFSFEEGFFVANKVTFGNKGNAFLVTAKSVKNMKKGVVLFAGLSSDAIKSVGFKIPHYGKYSYLVFADGKNVDKGTFAVADSPMQRSLTK